MDACVAPELLTDSLNKFRPLVFGICSRTPNHVDVNRVIETLRRDPLLSGRMYVIDGGQLAKNIDSRPADGRGKQHDGKRKRNSCAPSTRNAALMVYEEYVRIAVEREQARVSEVQKREAELERLIAEYMDDELSEGEARKAAEAELEDAAEDSYDGDERPARESFFLCIQDFPNDLDEVLQMQREGLALHVLLDVQSKVPLAGSIPQNDAQEKTRQRNERAKSPARRNKGINIDSRRDTSVLAQLLTERASRPYAKYDAVSEVLLHTYEFPTEPVSSQPTGCASAVYRLVGTEKAGYAGLRDALLLLEERCVQFHALQRGRVVVQVPGYTPMINPNAPPPPPVEEVDAVQARKKPTSHLSRSRSPEGRSSVTEQPVVPPMTPENPSAMNEVAAVRETYDTLMHQAKLNKERFSVVDFAAACISQAIVASGSSADQALLSEQQKEEADMLYDKDLVERFADEMFRSIMGDPLSERSQECEGRPLSISERRDRGCKASEMGESDTGLANSLDEGTEQFHTPSAASAHGIASAMEDSLKEMLIGMPTAVARQTLEGMLQTAVLCPSGDDVLLPAVCRRKNMLGWQRKAVHWGTPPLSVDFFSRANGCSREQHTVYSFEGPSTFPDFISALEFADREHAFYCPLPPDSDDDVVESSEDESEDEEEEDEKGNPIVRPKKVPTPPPVIDHVGVVQETLRRRRVYEDAVGRTTTQPYVQELTTIGKGARCAVEEVAWMFPSDGCTVEVERTCANTRHVRCSVVPPSGLELGFVSVESPATTDIQERVFSGVRSFVTLSGVIRLMGEVVADNSAAAMLMEYQRDVEAARKEAQAQFDALNIRTKPSRHRDKNAAPLPTLAALEEQYVNAVAKPVLKDKLSPSLQLVAFINEGDCRGVFDEKQCTFQMRANTWSHISSPWELFVHVWRNSTVERICLSTVSNLLFHMDGAVEVFSPELDGYRLVLGGNGSYMTSRGDVSLGITSKGCVVFCNGKNRTYLRTLKCASSTNNTRGILVKSREDGVQLVISGGRLAHIQFGGDVAATWKDQHCTWRFRGLPVVRCCPEQRSIGFYSCRAWVTHDFNRRAAMLTCEEKSSRALFDMVGYRLHVQPTECRSQYTVDCAFGGLYGEVATSHSVYRVSPFGRCSEQKDDDLVLPPGYASPVGRQPIVLPQEVVSPHFLSTLEGTDLDYNRDALHCMVAYDQPSLSDLPSPILEAEERPVKERLFEAEEDISFGALPDALQTPDSGSPVQCCVLLHGTKTAVAITNTAVDVVLRGRGPQHHWLPRSVPGLSQHLPLERMEVFSIGVAARSAGDLKGCMKAPKASAMERLVLTSPCSYEHTEAPRADSEQGCLLVTLPCSQPDATEEYVQYLLSGELLGLLQMPPEESADSNDAAITATAAQETSDTVPEGASPLTSGEESQSFSPSHKAIPTPPLEVSNFQHGWPGGRLNYWASSDAPLVLPSSSPYCRPQSNVESKRPFEPLRERKSTSGAVESAASVTKRSTTSAGCSVMAVSSPLMQSKRMRTEINTGTSASTWGHCPQLSVLPLALDFGTVLFGFRYAVRLSLTNISTVPCRFRFVVPSEWKPYVRMVYPHQFLAAGITVAAEVQLSGYQPECAVHMPLQVTHEGGSVSVDVHWDTVMEAHKMCSLGTHVECLGASIASFQPGTTIRAKTKNSDLDIHSRSASGSHTSTESEGNMSPSLSDRTRIQ